MVVICCFTFCLYLCRLLWFVSLCFTFVVNCLRCLIVCLVLVWISSVFAFCGAALFTLVGLFVFPCFVIVVLRLYLCDERFGGVF